MIIALDPGGTTGVVIKTNGHNYHYRHFGPDEHHYELYDWLRKFSAVTVICERFDFRQNARDNVDLISREYIGVAKLSAQHMHQRLVMQTASEAKVLITDEKLKRAGLFKEPHSVWPNMHLNDAMRHILYYQITQERDLELTTLVSGKT